MVSDYKPRILITALTLVFLVLSVVAQTPKPPLTMEDLTKALGTRDLTAADLVAIVQRRGVSFQMTADDEKDLRAAGAKSTVFAAIRANYRAPATAPAPAANPPATNAAPVAMEGEPFSAREIARLLRAQASVAQLQRAVRARGVRFLLTPELEQQLTGMGANAGLLSAINERHQ